MAISDGLLARLSDPSLLPAAGYIAGRWVSVSAAGRFQVFDPATGEQLADLPDFGARDAADAIDSAYDAQRAWAACTARDRGQVLRRLHDLVLDNIEDLAIIATAEMGKPLAEARGEVSYGASYIEWFAEEARRVYGDILPAAAPDRRMFVIKQPVGVVGAITPWNFPFAMLARKLAPALAAGCAVVAKPAELTPLSSIALAVLAERSGVPAGLMSVLTASHGAEIGREMCGNSKLRKISFTGSTEVGKTLMRQAADKVLRLSLELGGNAPFIVFDDADLQASVDGAIASKFRNSGQTCVCANRLYVQSGIHDAFVAAFSARVADLKLGHGLDADTEIGPLIDLPAVAKVRSFIDDARAKGACVVTGGGVTDQGETFFQPTVLTGVTAQMRVAREEIFGPIAPVFQFDTEAEVIAAANDTDYGLAAYFYTQDMARVWRVMEALEYGIVGVNTGRTTSESAPFGGIKQSGQGREGSRYGLDDYLELKYVCIGGL